MNRVARAIAQAQANIARARAAGTISDDEAARANRALTLDLTEYAGFHELKSAAAASGTLTPEEATTVYALMGTTPQHFNRQPLHVRAALLSLFRELMKRELDRQVLS